VLLCIFILIVVYLFLHLLIFGDHIGLCAWNFPYIHNHVHNFRTHVCMCVCFVTMAVDWDEKKRILTRATRYLYTTHTFLSRTQHTLFARGHVWRNVMMCNIKCAHLIKNRNLAINIFVANVLNILNCCNLFCIFVLMLSTCFCCKRCATRKVHKLERRQRDRHNRWG
jgi:hypothetical protein